MSNFENSTSPTSLLNLSNFSSQTAENNMIECPPDKNLAVKNLRGSLVKRPRGRPFGSKNKPRGNIANNPSPTQITNKVTLQLPPKVNIIQWVANFAHQNKVSVAILTGSGSISEVTLKCMGTQLPPQAFIEELNLISFSGVYIISPSAGGSTTTNFFNATLARKNGSVIGGSALHMVASVPILLYVLTFSDPEFYKIESLA